MDQLEDLSDLQEHSSNFILMPSQEESQDGLIEPEEQMKKMLKNLPALKVYYDRRFMGYSLVLFL